MPIWQRFKRKGEIVCCIGVLLLTLVTNPKYACRKKEENLKNNVVDNLCD